jgi:hypothetical protein
MLAYRLPPENRSVSGPTMLSPCEETIMERTSDSTTGRYGPPEQPGAHGIDEPRENRPGVPMETEPSPDPGAHWDSPARQQSEETHFRRVGLDRLTPVYGTAQPPRGLSGLMRRAAYAVPEHQARHWALLLAADRVDVLEDRLGEVLGGRLEEAGFGGLARQVERNPLPAVGLALLAGAVVRRVLR